jgi:hypothetical protein
MYRRGSHMSEYVRSPATHDTRLMRSGQASWKMSRWRKTRYSNSSPCLPPDVSQKKPDTSPVGAATKAIYLSALEAFLSKLWRRRYPRSYIGFFCDTGASYNSRGGKPGQQLTRI